MPRPQPAPPAWTPVEVFSVDPVALQDRPAVYDLVTRLAAPMRFRSVFQSLGHCRCDAGGLPERMDQPPRPARRISRPAPGARPLVARRLARIGSPHGDRPSGRDPRERPSPDDPSLHGAARLDGRVKGATCPIPHLPHRVIAGAPDDGIK